MKSPQNDSNNTRIAIIENNLTHINETLVRIEKRLDHIEAKMDGYFQILDKKIDNRFFWTLGALMAFVAAPIITAILKAIHLIP